MFGSQREESLTDTSIYRISVHFKSSVNFGEIRDSPVTTNWTVPSRLPPTVGASQEKWKAAKIFPQNILISQLIKLFVNISSMCYYYVKYFCT